MRKRRPEGHLAVGCGGKGKERAEKGAGSSDRAARDEGWGGAGGTSAGRPDGVV